MDPEYSGAIIQAVRIGFLIVLALMIGIIRSDSEHFRTILQVVRLGFLIILLALLITFIM